MQKIKFFINFKQIYGLIKSMLSSNRWAIFSKVLIKFDYFFFLVYLLILVGTTYLYYLINTKYLDLPDPVIPSIFYILLGVIRFGFKVALLAIIISFAFIDYYLYEPRYQFISQEKSLNLLITILGLGLSLLLGTWIRRHYIRLLHRNAELDSLIKARDQFASIAAHEIKTPLTTIKLYAQTLNQINKERKAGTSLNTTVEVIEKETDHLLNMVNLLLDFAKLQSGKYQLKKELFDLNDLLKERVDIMKNLYNDHQFILKPKKLRPFSMETKLLWEGFLQICFPMLPNIQLRIRKFLSN